MNETQRQTPQVTIEDLIRLKRAERPPAEFWVEFDRQMRAKQLAAIVKKQPTWQRWMETAFLRRRIQIPLGAAAALATVILVTRPHANTSTTVSSVSSVAAVPATTIARGSVITAPAATPTTSLAIASPKPQSEGSAPVTLAPSAADPKVAVAISSENSDTNASTPSASEVASIITEEPTSANRTTAEPSTSESSPSARYIAANLAVAEATEPEFIRSLTPSAISVRSLPGKVPTVEPLNEVSTPQDDRRQRLLAYATYNKTENTEKPGIARSRERITNRLNDESLYDSISRLGVNANQVSFKF